MTSEVCLMNRNAVVLAADSATTVTRWDNGKREERYFKGANKIFQLSNHQPVAIMINDSASILRVPWEVAIKEFRKRLAKTAYPNLRGYADAFFQFLNQSSHMFPEDVQDEVFAAAAFTAGANRIVSKLKGHGDKSTQQTLLQEASEELNIALEGKDLHPALRDVNLDAFKKRATDTVVRRLTEFARDIGIPLPSDLEQFSSGTVQLVLCQPASHLDTTGLVFAGYGEDDVFPSLLEYQSCGIVASIHLASDPSATAITHSTPAAISGFAQVSMINTFQMGISSEVYSDIMVSTGAGLSALRNNIEAALGETKTVRKAIEKADFDQIFDQAKAEIGRHVLDRMFAQNVAPMRNVLSSLPIDEMADLAESLIRLQSLKEKVTKPSETVGGPIDVAAITKSEGLVWIKRKHYFDPALNSRFAYRQMHEHH